MTQPNHKPDAIDRIVEELMKRPTIQELREIKEEAKKSTPELEAEVKVSWEKIVQYINSLGSHATGCLPLSEGGTIPPQGGAK